LSPYGELRLGEAIHDRRDQDFVFLIHTLHGEFSVGQSDFEKAFFVAVQELKKRAAMLGPDAIVGMRQDIDLDTKYIPVLLPSDVKNRGQIQVVGPRAEATHSGEGGPQSPTGFEPASILATSFKTRRGRSCLSSRHTCENRKIRDAAAFASDDA